MKVKDGGPAFPALDVAAYCTGMTLRDYFAAKAMAGILSNNEFLKVLLDMAGDETPLVAVTGPAYEYADAMLAAREAQS